MRNRSAPPPTPTPGIALDPHAFRQVLGCFGTGVTVATCHDGDRPVGVTINSFTSVSLTPPLILFCLSHNSRAHAAFIHAESFAINILTADQEMLARHFSSPEATDWTRIPTLPETAQPPLLQDCLSRIICRRHAVHTGGDHDILIGAVTELSPPGQDTAPLLYFRGQYRRFS